MIWQKIKRFLQVHDYLWSVFASFFCYWLLNWAPPTIGDVAITYYAINWVQPLIATAGIMSGLFAIARLGIWFNLRVFHRFIWPKKEFRENKNWQKLTDDIRYQGFNNLPIWQKMLFSLFFLALFLVIGVVIFLRLLSAAMPVPDL